MMKSLMLSIFVGLLASQFGQSSQAPLGAWLEGGIKWSKAPREISPKLSSGRAALVYFGPDHSFALIYATINRVQGGQDVICNGCGQVVYTGSWDLAGKTVKVKYRLVSRTVQVAGEQVPGPVKEDTADIQGSAVVFLGHSFHRSTDLDRSVLELISTASH